MDPLQVVGDAGVNAVGPRSGAAFPPAHDAQKEGGVPVAGHQWPAAVPFTRVQLPLDVTGAEHVAGELHIAALDALLRADAGHLQAAQ